MYADPRYSRSLALSRFMARGPFSTNRSLLHLIHPFLSFHTLANAHRERFLPSCPFSTIRSSDTFENVKLEEDHPSRFSNRLDTVLSCTRVYTFSLFFSPFFCEATVALFRRRIIFSRGTRSSSTLKYTSRPTRDPIEMIDGRERRRDADDIFQG